MVHIPADILARFLSQAALLKLTLAKFYGLNAIQLLTLILVGEAAIGVTIKELREKLAVPGSSLTFTLDSLERRKLIRRVRSKVDRRQWILILTARGRRLHSDMMAKETRAVQPSLEALSETESLAFLKIAREIGSAGTKARQLE